MYSRASHHDHTAGEAAGSTPVGAIIPSYPAERGPRQGMDAPTRFSLFLAILAMAVSLFFGFAPYGWRDMPRRARHVGLCVSGVFGIAAFAFFFLAPGVEYPDITLRFVGPKELDIQIQNSV